MICTLTVLGCSGGIGGDRRTTSLLVDNDTLIDCGTGVADLSLEQLGRISHVFLTHSHLDHIACLPLLLDAVGDERGKPLKVYGLPETLSALKAHIFNNLIWPDFTKIPSPQSPWITLHPISVGDLVKVSEKTVRALPACHSIPGIGYAVDSGESTLVFTGDTGPCPEFWQALTKLEQLKHLIIECSFTNGDAKLARISGHYHPETLASAFNPNLEPQTMAWISHLKPGSEALILSEITAASQARIQPLTTGQTIRF